MNRPQAPMLGALAAFAIMVAILGIIITYFLIEDDSFGEYGHSDSYDITGTYSLEGTPYVASGTADCRTDLEGSSIFVYTFSYDVKYGSDKSLSLTSYLMCNKKGEITSTYTYVSEGPDGHSLWKVTERGVDYTYEVGEHCKVYSIKVSSTQLNLTVSIINS